MTHYLSVLSTVALPIALVGILGFLLQRWRPLDRGTLVDVSLYVLAPSLVMTSLSNTKMGGGAIWQIVAFTVMMTVVTWLLAKLIAKGFHYQPEVEASLTLTTLFGNAVNYGLPVILLAYGMAGFVLAVSYVIGQFIILNSLGLYIASRSRVRPCDAIRQVLRMPLLYAVLVGVAVHIAGVSLPKGIESTLQLLGNAYVGIVLLILGTQFSHIRWTGLGRREVLVAILLRVIAVPVLSKLTLVVLGVHGLLASVLFVQSSMPAAVNTIIFADRFGSDREVVALTVVVTTLLSFVTLPLLILMG